MRRRLVVATTGDGRFTVIQQQVPGLEPGTVLVEVHAALVSPGSNLKGGWRAFAARRGGPTSDAPPKRLGYTNSGVVLDVGDGVEGLGKGDRVACIGIGYALVADYAVVPHHLCVRLPDAVSYEDGAYAILGATALHAVRRGGAVLASSALARHRRAHLAALPAGRSSAGHSAGAVRRVGDRAGSAHEIDAHAEAFTGGRGLDNAVLAFGGDANSGVVLAVGDVRRDTPWGPWWWWGPSSTATTKPE